MANSEPHHESGGTEGPDPSSSNDDLSLRDPGLRRAVSRFADHLPERIDVVEQAIRHRDVLALDHALRRLADAAKEDGFDQVYTAAIDVEQQIRPETAVCDLKAGVEALIDMCWRATHHESNG